MTKQAALTVTRVYVEAIEEDVAQVLLGERPVRLPSMLLPDGVTAGSWVELRIKALPEPKRDRPKQQ